MKSVVFVGLHNDGLDPFPLFEQRSLANFIIYILDRSIYYILYRIEVPIILISQRKCCWTKLIVEVPKRSVLKNRKIL